jgi:hypothetical protein
VLFCNIFICLQGKKVPEKKLAAIERLIEPWYLFSLVWSVGATVDGDSRKKFDVFLREKIAEENVRWGNVFALEVVSTLIEGVFWEWTPERICIHTAKMVGKAMLVTLK